MNKATVVSPNAIPLLLLNILDKAVSVIGIVILNKKIAIIPQIILSKANINKIAKEEGQAKANQIADSIIKNTYKTLMTRGMKGCYVYSKKKKLQEYLKNR